MSLGNRILHVSWWTQHRLSHWRRKFARVPEGIYISDTTSKDSQLFLWSITKTSPKGEMLLCLMLSPSENISLKRTTFNNELFYLMWPVQDPLILTFLSISPLKWFSWDKRKWWDYIFPFWHPYTLLFFSNNPVYSREVPEELLYYTHSQKLTIGKKLPWNIFQKKYVFYGTQKLLQKYPLSSTCWGWGDCFGENINFS